MRGVPIRGQSAAILRARGRMVRNAVVRRGRDHAAGTIIIAAVVTVAAAVIFRIFRGIFAGATVDSGSVGATVTGGLTLLTGFTAVTSITFALSSLYFARDLDMLLSAPLRPRQVILTRILGQLGLGAGLGVALAAPPLLAYTTVTHTVWAIPVVIVPVIALVVAPLCGATALTIVALRLIPARFVRDAGGLVVTVAVFVVTAINLALRGPDAFTGRASGIAFDHIGRGGAGGAWSPMAWTSRAIVDALRGDIVGWATITVPMVAVAAMLPGVVARICEAAYLTGFQRNGIARARRPRRESARSTRRGRRVMPAWLVIAVKDLREVRRDPSQMGQLLLPLVLFAFYLGRPTGSPGVSTGALPSWYLIALNASFGSLLFAANVALRGVGIEGQRIWLLRISPVRSADILAAKYAAGFIIAAIPACVLFWIGEARDHSPLVDVVLPTAAVCIMIGGVVAIAVGLGALRPRLDWTDPRRAVGIGVTLLYLAAGALYLVVCFIVMGLPYAFGRRTASTVVASIAGLVVVTGIVGSGALALGGRRLGGLEV